MVPNLNRALRGWTEKKTCLKITSTVSSIGLKEEVAFLVDLDVNLQPTPENELKKMPEEFWSWAWWNVIIKSKTEILDTDDAIIVDGARYRIQKVGDWRRSGFSKYQSIKDFDFEIETGQDGEILTYNGQPVLYQEEVVTYAGN